MSSFYQFRSVTSRCPENVGPGKIEEGDLSGIVKSSIVKTNIEWMWGGAVGLCGQEFALFQFIVLFVV